MSILYIANNYLPNDLINIIIYKYCLKINNIIKIQSLYRGKKYRNEFNTFLQRTYSFTDIKIINYYKKLDWKHYYYYH